MRTSLFGFLAVAATLFLANGTAHALSATYGGASCGSCDGSEFTLEITDNLDNTFDVKITLDSTGYDESRDGVAQIGFGGISGWSSATLDSSPASSDIAWSEPVEANINSSGLCSNGSTTGKLCSTGYTDIQADAQYVWEFTVTGGTLKLDTSEWHLGGQYANLSDLTDDDWKTPKGKVISEGGSAPVPEPSAALVFGAGLLVASYQIRSRKAAV